MSTERKTIHFFDETEKKTKLYLDSLLNLQVRIPVNDRKCLGYEKFWKHHGNYCESCKHFAHLPDENLIQIQEGNNIYQIKISTLSIPLHVKIENANVYLDSISSYTLISSILNEKINKISPFQRVYAIYSCSQTHILTRYYQSFPLSKCPFTVSDVRSLWLQSIFFFKYFTLMKGYIPDLHPYLLEYENIRHKFQIENQTIPLSCRFLIPFSAKLAFTANQIRFLPLEAFYEKPSQRRDRTRWYQSNSGLYKYEGLIYGKENLTVYLFYRFMLELMTYFKFSQITYSDPICSNLYDLFSRNINKEKLSRILQEQESKPSSERDHHAFDSLLDGLNLNMTIYDQLLSVYLMYL